MFDQRQSCLNDRKTAPFRCEALWQECRPAAIACRLERQNVDSRVQMDVARYVELAETTAKPGKQSGRMMREDQCAELHVDSFASANAPILSMANRGG